MMRAFSSKRQNADVPGKPGDRTAYTATADRASSRENEPDPFLQTLGKTVRALRAQHALTRRTLAGHAGVSERYLAKLEGGSGNASILVLRKLAAALDCEAVDLLAAGEEDDHREWAEFRALLRGKTSDELRKLRQVFQDITTQHATADLHRYERIALVGLRGAGKSTLGRMLAEDRKCLFVELSRFVAEMAGCPVPEIYSLYGETAYRRYERRAFEHVIVSFPRAVIALPGGLVSQTDTYSLVLKHCLTIWLTATPDDHMSRVIAQGDARPMAGYDEAMDDLHSILESRRRKYALADFTYDTSERPLAETYLVLRDRIANKLRPPPNSTA
ncbi:anaerobic benzoate catabolism transcriptional regulator [Paraburkholderia hospita]|uniref:Shikimate kinase n=2 Tax=Paraburkholderia hospita TaxID=169430 RepID=A0ABN0F9N2_9BURK|nr:anaerobic benzoate catabolism transcriptional regulator [Paraburkholderia hospita]OUL84694.1 shikimate kinase [Paraburkholderia hospita]